MLKRQRQSSPVHSTPYTTEPDCREGKRRRIEPPVLDGNARGWAAESDGESTDEEQTVQQYDHRDSEYKSVNEFLNQLHRHRPQRSSTKQSVAQELTHYEAQRNTQRYEDTNKLLSSLLLSRRKQLQDDSRS